MITMSHHEVQSSRAAFWNILYLLSDLIWFDFALGVATITMLIILLLLCGICVHPYHRPLGILLSKAHGIFNVRNDLSACCAHEAGETGLDESVQVCEKRSFALPRPGIEPRPLDYSAARWTNRPRTPVDPLWKELGAYHGESARHWVKKARINER